MGLLDLGGGGDRASGPSSSGVGVDILVTAFRQANGFVVGLAAAQAMQGGVGFGCFNFNLGIFQRQKSMSPWVSPPTTCAALWFVEGLEQR